MFKSKKLHLGSKNNFSKFQTFIARNLSNNFQNFISEYKLATISKRNKFEVPNVIE